MPEVKLPILPPMFPNYLRVDGPIGDSHGIDVGFLFATDREAHEYWKAIAGEWIAHVAKRREQLGKTEVSK